MSGTAFSGRLGHPAPAPRVRWAEITVSLLTASGELGADAAPTAALTATALVEVGASASMSEIVATFAATPELAVA